MVGFYVILMMLICDFVSCSVQTPVNEETAISKLAGYNLRHHRLRYRRSTSCVLPPAPDNGSYTSNVPDATEGQTFPILLLKVTCLPGYKVDGKADALCHNGIWLQALPSCVPDKEASLATELNELKNITNELQTAVLQLTASFNVERAMPVSPSIDELRRDISQVKEAVSQLTTAVNANHLQTLFEIYALRASVERQSDSRIATTTTTSAPLLPMGLKTGAECDWSGLKGVCVDSQTCISTLDIALMNVIPVCPQIDNQQLICCTDCNVVNATRSGKASLEAVTKQSTGQKSRDNCLKYLKEVYNDSCGIVLDGENKCSNYQFGAAKNFQAFGTETPISYPYQALLGYGEDVEIADKWGHSGVIISDRFVLISGYRADITLSYIFLGVQNRTGSRQDWQVRQVKRRIRHPMYKQPDVHYNDIALVETETPIEFNENVLPACLPSAEWNDEEATLTTWSQTNEFGGADNLRSVDVQRYSQEECAKVYSFTKSGYNHTSQMCFGHRKNLVLSCTSFGDPLIVNNHISSCVFTVTGIKTNSPYCSEPSLYTRVSHYVPWIESVVWP